MNRKWIGFTLGLPFSDAPGDPGGGGGADLGGGAPAADPAAPAEPSIIELDDNALIKPRGSEKPIKFSEYRQGFQSQATKAAQKAAQVERELEQTRGRLAEFERQRQLAAQSQGSGAQPNIYEQLKQLPYLSGEDAWNMTQAISNELKVRDQILVAALRQQQQMQQVLERINRSYTDSSFDTKIGKFIQDGGYDPEWTDFAKELYMAYEGDDLDAEFPNILRQRIEQAERLIEKKRQAAVANARRTAFVPGRGGQAGPSKPLQIPANASPSEVADQLFDLFQGTQT